MEKELSSATHVPTGSCAIPETADDGLSPKGIIKPPRLVACPANAAKPFGIVKSKTKSAHPSPLELIPILKDAKLP